jgi:hypothetical protein
LVLVLHLLKHGMGFGRVCRRWWLLLLRLLVLLVLMELIMLLPGDMAWIDSRW